MGSFARNRNRHAAWSDSGGTAARRCICVPGAFFTQDGNGAAGLPQSARNDAAHLFFIVSNKHMHHKWHWNNNYAVTCQCVAPFIFRGRPGQQNKVFRDQISTYYATTTAWPVCCLAYDKRRRQWRKKTHYIDWVRVGVEVQRLDGRVEEVPLTLPSRSRAPVR